MKIFEYFYRKKYTPFEDISIRIRPNTKLYKIDTEIIKNVMKDNPRKCLSIEKIRKLYMDKDDSLQFSKSTLQRVIINRLGGKYKNPKFRTFHSLTNKNLVQRSIFLKKIVDILQTECEIIFIDQSSFQNFSKKSKTWILSEDEGILPFPGRLKSLNLIYACSRHGSVHFQINDCRTESIIMIKFINEMVKKLRVNPDYKHKLANNKIWIYLDGASYHTSKLVTSFLKNGDLNAIFPPTYQPEYNMAEYIFGYLKRLFYKEVFETR